VAIFYDSAGAKFPPGAQYVTLYADGRYEQPASAASKWPHVRWITVYGGAHAGRYAGILDWEAGNAGYPGTANMVAWAEERKAMNCLARCYCNRSDLPRAHAAIGHLPNVRWWIATLDNVQRSEAAMIANIRARTGIVLPPGVLWGQQFAGGMTAAWDTSILYGRW